MRILLTNDDGIHAPGIIAMYKALQRCGQVDVVAPETVQSAAGHGITIEKPILTSKVTIPGAYSGIAVDGRPADCVKLALSHLLESPPDLVVSGMNSGVNVGINVIYSGTVAAAIEGAFLGLPSIAVSLLLRADVPTDYDGGAAWGAKTIEQILERGLKPGQVASINLPALRSGEKPAGVRVVRQCVRPWTDTYEKRSNPRGRDYFWNSSIFRLGESENDTDVAAIRDGYITVTPLQFDLTHRGMMDAWKTGEWSV